MPTKLNIGGMEAAYAREAKINKDKYHGLQLSSAEEAILVDRILSDVEEDEKNRSEFLEKVVEVMNLYEGKNTRTTKRYEDEPNVSTHIVTMTVETLHSILFPTVWNEDLQTWSPNEAGDARLADKVNQFMRWDSSYTGIAMTIDDWVKRAILEGTVVSKVRWVTDWEWKQRKTPRQKNILKKAADFVRKSLAGKPDLPELDEGDFDIEYYPRKNEYCTVDLIPLEDVGFPVWNNPTCNSDELEHIWHRYPKFLHEIRALEQRGLFRAGSTDLVGGHIEQCLMQKEGTTSQRMDAEGSAHITAQKGKTPAKIIEWYGKVEVDGAWEDIIAWVDSGSKSLLAATFLRQINQRNRRPFNIAQFIRRPGRMYGLGIGEIVMEFQKIMDEMMNTNLQAAKMAVYPPGFYRASSGFDPEQITIQPGIMIPVDDIDDAKWVTIPNNILPNSQEMKFILELVQQISSIGAYQTGQESSVNRSRSTARGTLALIAQGERRFVVLGKRLQYMLAKIMKAKLEYYQQYLPPGIEQRIMNSQGEPLFPEGIDLEDMIGDYDLHMSLDATGGSKALKVENAVAMYQGYVQNPLVLEDKARLWELSAYPMRESGVVDVEKYLGAKPPSIEEQAQAAGVDVPTFQAMQQQQAMMAQAQLAGQASSAAPSSSGAQTSAPSAEPAPSPDGGAA